MLWGLVCSIGQLDALVRRLAHPKATQTLLTANQKESAQPEPDKPFFLLIRNSLHCESGRSVTEEPLGLAIRNCRALSELYPLLAG